MPHYRDGTEAKVGDLVKGRGYNVPHEIIGQVVEVRPGANCTLSVAYVGAKPYRTHISVGLVPSYDPAKGSSQVLVLADIEYGDTAGFDLISIDEPPAKPAVAGAASAPAVDAPPDPQG